MVEKKEDTKIWGIPVNVLVSILQTVGVPTLFMIFICYLGWQYIPTVVSAHVELLQRTGDTLDDMNKTLKEYDKTVQEFSDLGKRTSDFMERVRLEHVKAQESLTNIEKKVNANK